MDDKIEPCPFCGSPAEEGSDETWGSFVFCTNEETCNALQHNFGSEDLAIAAWNTRAAYEVMTRSDGEAWFDKAIRDHCDEHGPSGGAWNISMVLERLHRAALTQSSVQPD